MIIYVYSIGGLINTHNFYIWRMNIRLAASLV